MTETSETLTDLLYTNCPDKIVCSGVRHIGITDHSVVFAYRKFSIHGSSRGHCTITYRNYRKFNLESFCNDIASHDWDHIHNLSNPNDMWSEWKKSFLEIVDKHVPLRKARVRGRTHLTYAGFSADNIQSCLNDDLVNVSNWLRANKLTLNMTKTEFMLIGSRQRLCTLTFPPRPSINGSPIEHVTTAKSLGVLIDDKLTWRSHIDKLTQKIASGFGAIQRIRHLVPYAYGTLHSIYQALVQPHFNYCNIVWGNCGVTLQDKLQKLQKRAAHVLTYSNYDADVNNLFELLGSKTLVSQRQIVRATMVFKSLQGLAPEYLCSKFVHRDSGYCLRDSVDKVNDPQPRTNYCKNSFSYSGAVSFVEQFATRTKESRAPQSIQTTD